MTIRNLLTALTTAALLTGAMLSAPNATTASGANNAIAVDPNLVFMKNLNGLAIGDSFTSSVRNSTREVTDITAGALDCHGACDDQGFFLAEGTMGWLVGYSDVDLYGDYTEDTLSYTGSQHGLTATVYHASNTVDGGYTPWTGAFPDGISLCKTFIAENIYIPDSSEDIFGCGADNILIHYVGNITVPITGSYTFTHNADDGFYLLIDERVILNDWRTKGCSDNIGSSSITLSAGQAVSIDAWYSQGTGGSCVELFVARDSGSSGRVDSDWFTRSGANCGDLDAAVCPTITDAGTNLVTGAPGSDYTTARATYTWLRCRSEGDAIVSRRAPTGCRVIRSTRSTAARMENAPYRISAGDRRWGYLRLGVTIGHTTYYSGAYDLNQ